VETYYGCDSKSTAGCTRLFKTFWYGRELGQCIIPLSCLEQQLAECIVGLGLPDHGSYSNRKLPCLSSHDQGLVILIETTQQNCLIYLEEHPEVCERRISLSDCQRSVKEWQCISHLPPDCGCER